MDLQEQIMAISKAGAYDAIAQDYGRVKEQNVILKAAINNALNEMVKSESIINDPAVFLTHVSRPLLDALKQTL